MTEWDRDQIGNPEAEPVSESEYETGEMWEAEMEPDKVYRISAVWVESKAQVRGVSGGDQCAVLTEYAITISPECGTLGSSLRIASVYKGQISPSSTVLSPCTLTLKRGEDYGSANCHDHSAGVSFAE